jgi:hypothetical protein
MQQLIALGIATLVWGVVCFLFGFSVASLRSLSEENTMLRSTVSALSRAPMLAEQCLPQQQWAAIPKGSAPPLQRQPTVAPQPQPLVARKMYLFGDPHFEQVSEPHRQPRPTQATPSAWPGQQHLAPPRVTGSGTDLLPRRPQHGRHRLRRRR